MKLQPPSLYNLPLRPPMRNTPSSLRFGNDSKDSLSIRSKGSKLGPTLESRYRASYEEALKNLKHFADLDTPLFNVKQTEKRIDKDVITQDFSFDDGVLRYRFSLYSSNNPKNRLVNHLYLTSIDTNPDDRTLSKEKRLKEIRIELWLNADVANQTLANEEVKLTGMKRVSSSAQEERDSTGDRKSDFTVRDSSGFHYNNHPPGQLSNGLETFTVTREQLFEAQDALFELYHRLRRETGDTDDLLKDL